MKKKLLSIFIALVLALSLCLVTAAPVGADTINVASGQSIQAAINAASNGDIIIVAAGTCTENIDVNKRVILQASGTVTVNPASGSDHIFHVTANNVTIDGFTLVGDTLDPTSRGVLLDGVTGCTISNNDWSTTVNGIAIHLNSADSNIIQGNTCTTTYTSGSGIYLITSDSNVVKDNTCTGGSENIWIEGSLNTIQGNTCSGSSIGNGIALSGATVALTGNLIKGNTCSNNSANGISIVAWPNSISDTTVIGNTLTGNSNGILLDSDSGAVLGITITKNTCQSNTNAIKIYDVYAGSVITISDNDISSNTAVGILIDNTYGNADATYVTASPDNSIVNNTTYGADNQGAGNLNATGNWWGTAVAGEIPAMISGTVTYTGHLTTAPGSVGLTVVPDILPTVATTSPATNIGFTSATLNGDLTAMGTASQVDVWLEWGTTTSYGQTTPFETKTGTGTFTADLTGLAQNTTYHFRAVARSADGTTTGADVSFLTLDALAVTTNAATNVALYSATLNGNLTNKGSAGTVAVSFEWDTDSGTPYANETTPVNVTTTGTFSAGLTSLTHNTTYYFRAKAVGGTTAYGAEVSFTTVAERIGISVSPTSIDFGSILAGSSSGTKTVTITNEGNVVERFTASLSDEVPSGFYTANLAIATFKPVTGWSAPNIAVAGTATPDLVLTIPGGVTPGSKTATITFIAVKQ